MTRNRLIYTVYFTVDNGKGSDLWGQYETKAEADRTVKHLWNDESVILVTVDITRSAK